VCERESEKGNMREECMEMRLRLRASARDGDLTMRQKSRGGETCEAAEGKEGGCRDGESESESDRERERERERESATERASERERERERERRIRGRHAEICRSRLICVLDLKKYFVELK
jgi:hypothetical protein